MKLHQEDSVGQNHIRSFSQNNLLINQATYHHSVLVAPNYGPIQWRPSCLKELRQECFEFLLGHVVSADADLILLGTGMTHEFISPELYQGILNLNIPVECMSTSAACRTYTVLSSESRSVMAALLLS